MAKKIKQPEPVVNYTQPKLIFINKITKAHWLRLWPWWGKRNEDYKKFVK